MQQHWGYEEHEDDFRGLMGDDRLMNSPPQRWPTAVLWHYHARFASGRFYHQGVPAPGPAARCR
jgi:hypothetical protein